MLKIKNITIFTFTLFSIIASVANGKTARLVAFNSEQGRPREMRGKIKTKSAIRRLQLGHKLGKKSLRLLESKYNIKNTIIFKKSNMKYLLQEVVRKYLNKSKLFIYPI